MILVLGSTGQLGTRLKEQLGNAALYPTRAEADFSKPASIRGLLDQLRPTQIFNACAYTDVDGAEKDPTLASLVNTESPRAIAQWCSENSVPWVHFSTDYVFSGVPPHAEGWNEADSPLPLNMYGKTKLEGERAVLETKNSKSLILRTSWVYSELRKNFLKTLLSLAQRGEPIPVVTDQRGTPTDAGDLARASIQALNAALKFSQFPTGVYHTCPLGSVSRYEWAQAFFSRFQSIQPSFSIPPIEPILTSQFRKRFPHSAKRPLDSRLDTRKIRDRLGVFMPHWEVGMEKTIERLMP